MSNVTDGELEYLRGGDDLPPWQPRGVEIRGRAEALSSPQPLIRVYPERIVSWGIESRAMGDRHSRSM